MSEIHDFKGFYCRALIVNPQAIDVTEATIVDATLVNKKSQPWPVWKRVLAGFVALAVAAGLGWSFWITGMLMFMFSLDGASASDIPDWVEPFMLVAWGAIVIVTVVLPPLLFMCGVSVKRCAVALAILTVASVVSPMVAWVATMVAISK